MKRSTWGLTGVVLLALVFSGACLLSGKSPLARPETPAAPPPATPSPVPTLPADEEKFAKMRSDMVDRTIRARGVVDPEVLRAMATVPRHRFVPDHYLGQAYADHPLPIGYGQTISQPYIVALMTELLALGPQERVLEIGTGSGYQAAVLAELVQEIYSVEIIPELAEIGSQRLQALGYDNVRTKQGDGYYGWEEHAPFDAIIVTCAPDHVPQPLINQLAEGGRLVAPIGPPGGYQTLWQYVREEDGLRAYNIGGVRFVPLVREVPTADEQ
jgi:protein-L-isoaspartate(D-aspartate) O-methyltransferase